MKISLQPFLHLVLLLAATISTAFAGDLSVTWKGPHDADIGNDTIGWSGSYNITITNAGRAEFTGSYRVDNSTGPHKGVSPRTGSVNLGPGKSMTLSNVYIRGSRGNIPDPIVHLFGRSESVVSSEKPKGNSAFPLWDGKMGTSKPAPKSADQEKWERERLTGDQVKTACLNFYSTQGEWAGQFRITGVTAMRAVSRGGGRYTIHMGYNYVGIRGPRRGEVGRDQRTFEIVSSPGGGCRAIAMGGYMSANL